MRGLGMAALVVALATAGCAAQDAAPTAPVTLAPPSVTDTFTGTLIALTSNLHTFSVTQLGEVNVTLQSTTLLPTIDPETGAEIPPADPKAVPKLTIAIGTPTTTIFGLQCATIFFGTQAMQVNAVAGSTAQLRGSALPGNFCVAIGDSAGENGGSLLTAAVDYTITVAHP